MKRFLANLVLILIINILISVYLSGIPILNVLPAVDLTFMVVYAANANKNEAILFGFLMGLCVDILFGTSFGFNTLMYMYLALGVNFFAKNFMNNEPLSVLIMLVVSVIIFDFAHYLFFFAFEGQTFGLKLIFKMIIPELIYTVVLYFPLQYLVLKYKRLLEKFC